MKKLIINALFYGFLLIISPANAEEDTETYNATPDGVVVLYINVIYKGDLDSFKALTNLEEPIKAEQWLKEEHENIREIAKKNSGLREIEIKETKLIAENKAVVTALIIFSNWKSESFQYYLHSENKKWYIDKK